MQANYENDNHILISSIVISGRSSWKFFASFDLDDEELDNFLNWCLDNHIEFEMNSTLFEHLMTGKIRDVAKASLFKLKWV